MQQKIPNCYTLQPLSLQTHDSSETALVNAIRKKTNAKSKPNSLIVSYFFPIHPQKKLSLIYIRATSSKKVQLWRIISVGLSINTL